MSTTERQGWPARIEAIAQEVRHGTLDPDEAADLLDEIGAGVGRALAAAGSALQGSAESDKRMVEYMMNLEGRLLGFLFTLMRDHVAMSTVEETLRGVEMAAYRNGTSVAEYVGAAMEQKAYPEHVVLRLLGHEPPPPLLKVRAIDARVGDILHDGARPAGIVEAIRSKPMGVLPQEVTLTIREPGFEAKELTFGFNDDVLLAERARKGN